MEIQGQGFKLRGWKMDDMVAIQKHADNPNVYSFLLDKFPHPYTMAAAEIWVNNMLALEPNYNFVIDVDGEAVGVIGLEMRDDVYRKTALVGYWLGEEYWGNGIMVQALEMITAYAFGRLGLIRLQAGVLSNNPRSMRVLEKAGYLKEGVLKNNILKKGIILDEHIYAALKDPPFVL
jgi:RimJ/RimL family protein N-acetyltransferase